MGKYDLTEITLTRHSGGARIRFPELRNTLWLQARLNEGMSHAEIAECVGCSVSIVMSACKGLAAESKTGTARSRARAKQRQGGEA